jgi:anaerobic magnesium-protoporphyrin IX monomethyl ester cyclase
LRILVVAPKYTNNIGEYYNFPLGIAYISAALKAKGYEVFCLNLSHKNDVRKSLSECILNNDIDIVATGGLSVHFDKIVGILDLARQIKPEVITIIGGGIITSDPEDVFELLPQVDYGVIGEGEVTIVELVKAIVEKMDLHSVKGILFRDSTGKVTVTETREAIDDLDSIPFPDYEGFEASKYLEYQMSIDEYDMSIFDRPRMLPIISSRSCPFKCTFCFHPLGNKYRQRSIECFFQELDYLLEKYQINYASVYDELFSNDKKRIIAFSQEMKKRNIKWMTQLRVDKVDEEMLRLLKESGLFLISYGIESADARILKSMNKHITIEQVERALELTRKVQIGFTGNLIFGDTEETMETATNSLNWFNKHMDYLLGLIPISLYPGTPLYWRAIEDGIIKDKKAYLRKPGLINASKMSDADYADLMDKAKVNFAKACLKSRGKLKKMQLSFVDDVKGTIYTIEATCPFCNNDNKYPNLNLKGIDRIQGLLVLCKNCGSKYIIYDSILSVLAFIHMPKFVRLFFLKFRVQLARILKFFRL